MNKIKTENKKMVSILGLPRQGTTLIAGIINSYDNSFCSVEPHWAKIANQGQSMNSGIKIPTEIMYNNTVDKFVPVLRDFLDESKIFSIGSIKETYRSHQKESCNYLLKSDLIDIHLFIFREPKSGFNAWKRVGWGGFYDDVDNYIDSYTDLWNDGDYLLSQNKRIIRIKYEELCSGNASNYLNSKFESTNIIFPENIQEIKQIGSIFGDPHASRGGKINSSNNDFELLNEGEIKKLNPIIKRYYSVI